MNHHVFFATMLLTAASLFGSGCATTQPVYTRYYEMRTYFVPPGKLDALHARFRDHTTKFFEKYGMENIGYFVPVDNKENKLIYLLAYQSPEARDAAWKAFSADPAWQAAKQKSEVDGPLVERVEQIFMETTDYSPGLETGDVSKGGIFELRTYTTPSGLLPNLDARFRKYTMELFAKHGMRNWIYFHKTPGQPSAENTLIYFLAHKSPEAAKASFDAFRKDPAWVAVKGDSEKNGSLTVKDGVKSLLLTPTDYSPTK